MTLSAMPWYVTPRSTRRPRAPILRGRGPSGSHQQPGWPSRRAAAHAVGGTGRHEGRLQCPDERANEQAAIVQGDDRVRHELAGTVVRDLAAALDADHRDAAGLELVGAGQDVGRIAVAPERQDRRVLEQEEPVADRARRPARRPGAAGARAPRRTARGPSQCASSGRDVGRFEVRGRGGGRHRTMGEQVGLHRRTIAGRPARARRPASALVPTGQPKSRSIAATIARPSAPSGSFSGL